MTLRLLDTGTRSGAFNMGLDEAVLDAVAEGSSPPTLRLYAWSPATVTVGYFQSMREEVDVAACDRLGIDYTRRLTGGGAVFHDAEITYSIIMGESHPLARRDVLASYEVVCGGIIASLARFGVKAEFAPINDVISGGKKISGNAQTRKKGCILQHGTVILSLDADKMFTLLLVPQEKLKGKMIQAVKERVTSMEALLGRPVAYDEAAREFALGFADHFKAVSGVSAERGEPKPSELAAAERIAAERYSQAEWKFKR